MVYDAVMQDYGHEMHVGSSMSVVEEPNAESQKFYELLEHYNEPVWWGSDQYYALSIANKLLSVKSDYNCPQGAINELLAIIPGLIFSLLLQMSKKRKMTKTTKRHDSAAHLPDGDMAGRTYIFSRMSISSLHQASSMTHSPSPNAHVYESPMGSHSQPQGIKMVMAILRSYIDRFYKSGPLDIYFNPRCEGYMKKAFMHRCGTRFCGLFGYYRQNKATINFLGEAHLAELQEMKTAGSVPSLPAMFEKYHKKSSTKEWVSPFAKETNKNVTQTTTQETNEMLKNSYRAELWRKVIGKNKKGHTYRLIDLPPCSNCHEAGPSGTASNAHPATHEHSMMMKLVVKLTKKVERVIAPIKKFHKESKKNQSKKNDISQSKKGRRQNKDEDENKDETHEESDKEFSTDD
ncbi:hypothetical protein CRG98_020957 [Punica granatum]|uniref:Uncharacterized protein n=1 Tax=Punica granatum TaxID=22663 RepID=A0A2I0JQX0_PUNGR|nr:hypothetical protein CRG98_020957 [Punica granatum]